MEMITNEQLQKKISDRIQRLDFDDVDLKNTKIFLTGATSLLRSVKLDLDVTRGMGRPLLPRTCKFLGVADGTAE